MGVMDRYTEFCAGVDWFFSGGEEWAASPGWDQVVWVWGLRSVMGSQYDSPGRMGSGREFIIMCLISYHDGHACRDIRRPGLLPKKHRLLHAGTGTVC